MSYPLFFKVKAFPLNQKSLPLPLQCEMPNRVEWIKMSGTELVFNQMFYFR